ncbi:MAG: hypothetical protein H7Z43_10560, partial [Clostridia bacterium]|nr:hypothetical protein [Deltaproteobacteria bacterium]
ERASPAIAAGEQRFEATWLSPSGITRELGISMVRYPSHRPDDVTRVFVFRDMGEWRQRELELRRVKGLNALGQMAAGFAHEVRNPLAAMRSLAEELRTELGEQHTCAHFTERMIRLADRVDGLVGRALRFARPKPPERRVCQARSIVEEAIDSLVPRLEAGRRPRVAIADDLADVLVDDVQMVEIVINLIENALDAAGEPERVQITASHDSEFVPGQRFVRINIIDDGPGILPDHLPLVFDPFFTTKKQGTGLGLAIAQRLARDNGGHLIAVSVPGVNTTFTLFLPVLE